jgi:hypothetical protein
VLSVEPGDVVDLLTERGLRDVQALRSTRELQVLRKDSERLEQPLDELDNADTMQGVGVPAMRELLSRLRDDSVPVLV